MKHISSMLLFLSLFFSACSPVSPEKYFDVAVLNTNVLAGFANEGQLRELQSPSVRMSEQSTQPVAMKRSEVIHTKIQFIEANLGKLKALTTSADTKEMVETSVALYEHVLAVYKKEYIELARLFDEGSTKEQIQQKAQFIENKYYPRHEELYARLIAIGKSYAEKHDIKVNWAM